MNKDLYNELVAVIESGIEKKLNGEGEFSWREINSMKNQSVYESIKYLISFLRSNGNYAWTDNEYDILSKQDRMELSSALNKIIPSTLTFEVSVSNVYQLLMADDLIYVNGEYTFIVDKHQRDNLGAYYTPDWLADQLTEKTVNSYIQINFHADRNRINKLNMSDFTNVKVADLSVGAGVFLRSYIRWIKKNFSPEIQDLKKLAQNLYGVDVDPTALLICKHEVSSEFEGELSSVNLFLGNPLIPNCSSNDGIRKSLFYEGRIYNKNSGLSNKFFDVSVDIVLGNPPWEKIRFEERKFIKPKYQNIAKLSQKKLRDRAIEALSVSAPADYLYYTDVFGDYAEIKELLKSNSQLENSLTGELNTYNLFYELAINIINKKGVVGLIVKSSMVKTPANKKIFNHLVLEGMLMEVDIIKNTKKIFDIDSREEFAFVISSLTYRSQFAFFSNITSKEDFYKQESEVKLTQAILKKINPVSGMLPNISTAEQMAFVDEMYSRNPLFSEVFPEVKFGRLVHFTNHSEYISKKEEEGLPIYEGKFIERYDSRFSTFEGMTLQEKYRAKASARLQSEEEKRIPESRYFINKNFWKSISKNYDNKLTIMWRSLTSSTNRRTMLATLLPFLPTSQSIQFLQASSVEESIVILAIFNSIIYDYLVRMKLPGIDLTQSVVKSIPVPCKEKLSQSVTFKGKKDTYSEHISQRVRWIFKNETRLDSYFGVAVENQAWESKKKCEVELDLLVGQLYGLSFVEIKKIASNFPAYYSFKELELLF